jgi:hypothetical protein
VAKVLTADAPGEKLAAIAMCPGPLRAMPAALKMVTAAILKNFIDSLRRSNFCDFKISAPRLSQLAAAGHNVPLGLSRGGHD